MADTSAWLVDEVLPEVPVRQWVLSVPWPVRFALARDAKLLTKALGIFVGELFRDLRRRIGASKARRPGIPNRRGDCGAVTGVQRFGGALNLNVHFHTIVLDGVYVRGRDGETVFRAAPRLTEEDVARVLGRVRTRIDGMLRKAGALSEESEPVELEPLDLFQVASVRGRVAISDTPKAVAVMGGDGLRRGRKKRRLCADNEGYNLQAAVRMRAGNREGLETLCRYVLRPSFAAERLEQLPDRRIAYGFRRRWEDGSSHVIFTPMELMEKLAALIPPPWHHVVRYHGVLAPHAEKRKKVVKGVKAVGTDGAEVAPAAPAAVATEFVAPTATEVSTGTPGSTASATEPSLKPTPPTDPVLLDRIPGGDRGSAGNVADLRSGGPVDVTSARAGAPVAIQRGACPFGGRGNLESGACACRRDVLRWGRRRKRRR